MVFRAIFKIRMSESEKRLQNQNINNLRTPLIVVFWVCNFQKNHILLSKFAPKNFSTTRSVMDTHYLHLPIYIELSVYPSPANGPNYTVNTVDLCRNPTYLMLITYRGVAAQTTENAVRLGKTLNWRRTSLVLSSDSHVARSSLPSWALAAIRNPRLNHPRGLISSWLCFIILSDLE